jgi:anti-sigma-K factor RskA
MGTMSDDLNERHDPDWLAQRYVRGELDDADAVAFEERLATDEAAAAALASAVRLCAALEAARAAEPATSAVPGSVPREHPAARPAARGAESRGRLLAGRGLAIGVMATATALSLLLFLDPAALRRPAADAVARRTESVRQVALSADLEADEPPESDDVPEWLLAAVALEADGGGPVREN